jgi:RNA polymerase sigma factor (sigma-70 family)
MKKKLKPEELTQLVIQSQAGDLNAYSKIVRNFQDMAVGYSYSILGSFQLAEDAAQEAFIEAYLNLSKLRSPTVFPGWLKKIIFKHCDRFTRGKGFAIVALEDTDELASIHPEPTQIALENEVKDIVHCSIQTLPEGDRIVVTLFYISGYSQKEISNFLGLPISTIKNRLHSALNPLRTKMIDRVSDNLHFQRPSRNCDEYLEISKFKMPDFW